MPEIPTKIMMNVGTPEQAFTFAQLPNAGVGLARLEFIINRQIGIHPKALLDLDDLEEPLKSQISETIAAYPGPREFFVQRVAEGISTLAAAFAPNPVIVRMSDFKSNEYANLVGGELFEPHEENPMIGYRGASRYLSAEFADCFAMEAEALRFVRDEMGLTNVKIMIPFVRTVAEAKGVIDLLAEHGLRRGENDLQVVMMCEVPSNAILAEEFLEHFDGFSIGSNDMTQLTLGLDRDSSLVAASFDERDPAVMFMLERAIKACREAGQVRRHLRPGPQRPPRPGRVAARAGHRVDVAQPRHGRRHLAAAWPRSPNDGLAGPNESSDAGGTRSGGSRRSSTRSTRRASPTATATGSATSAGSSTGSTTSSGSAWTPSG